MGSPYRPVAVYVKSEQMFPSRSEVSEGSSARVRLVLEERRDSRGLRVIIRDLTNDEATQFTSSLERKITAALKGRFKSYEVAVQRSRVGPHFYAP